MKKIIAGILISFGIPFIATAQSDIESALFSGADINGTARYTSMAGAFSALGGDASAIHLNPAGLGVYRKAEISLSGGININSTNSLWNNNAAKDNRLAFSLDNAAVVLSFIKDNAASGYVGSNVAVTYNNLKKYSRSTRANGKFLNTSLLGYMTEGLNGDERFATIDEIPFDLEYMAAETGLLVQDPMDATAWLPYNTAGYPSALYLQDERGTLDEWGISYAANISNKLYIGAQVGIQTLNYKSHSYYAEVFGEDGSNGYDYEMYNYLSTSGTGVNFKLGAIYLPVRMLRLGASVSTPTFMGVTSYFDSELYNNTNNSSYRMETANIYYRQQGQWRGNFGAAVLFGQKGLISFDYGIAGMASTSVFDTYGSKYAFEEANNKIAENLKTQHSFKVGAEFMPLPQLALRLGYAHITSPFEKGAVTNGVYYTDDTSPDYTTVGSANYASAGVGFRAGIWFFDFAYQFRHQKLNIIPYNLDTETGEIAQMIDATNLTHNIIASVGIKF